jgi:hypothetical protein
LLTPGCRITWPLLDAAEEPLPISTRPEGALGLLPVRTEIPPLALASDPPE